MSFDASVLNKSFVDNLSAPGGIEKLAQEMDLFVKMKVREESFADKILEPATITIAECDKSAMHPNPIKIISKEPDSEAMSVNFRGDPDGTYLENNRYQINFFPIESKEISKKEMELITETAPITQIIEENVVKDIYEQNDNLFIKLVENIIHKNKKSMILSGPVTKAKMVQGFKMLTAPSSLTLSGTILHPEKAFFVDKMLMHEALFEEWQAVDTNLGLNLISEVTINGYKYNTIMNKIVVRTLRPVVPYGTIYFFTQQKFMGHAFILQEPRFMIHKVFDLITMKAQVVRGRGFGNILGVAKLTLV